MKCLYCDGETKVVETRETSDATRRRRECTECDERFTTYEKPETQLMVVKKNGETTRFKREKVEEGIRRACKKRPVDDEQIDALVTELINDFQERGRRKVTTEEIGKQVLAKLKQLDEVAYMRFASVYREFSDVDSFETELKRIVKKEEI